MPYTMYEKQYYAKELIKRGARPKTIEKYTGISIHLARELCKKNGIKPTQNKSRRGDHWYIAKMTRMKEVQLFYICYKLFIKIADKTERIIYAYDLYKEVSTSKTLSLFDVSYPVEFIETKAWQETKCSCGSFFIGPYYAVGNTCYLCKVRDNYVYDCGAIRENITYMTTSAPIACPKCSCSGAKKEFKKH